MPTRTVNFWNFNLFDFFVGVISGLVAFTVFYSIAPGYVVSQIPEIDGVLLLLVLLILSYVLGRLIQATARGIETGRLIPKFAPDIVENWIGERKPFEDELEDSNENQVYKKFLELSQDYFDISVSEKSKDERETDLDNLFMLTRAYLTNNSVSPRVERFHATYLLFLNLSFIFILGGIIHTIGILAHFGGHSLISVVWPRSIVLVILLVLGAVLCYDQREWYHDRMAKVMIFDFYADIDKSPEETA